MAELEIVKTPKRQRKAWKEEELKCLIENYEDRPCLWDVHSKDYHNKDKRAAAVADIEQALDVSRDEIISKWNTLRGQFSREMNLTSKMKSGSGLEERYESKWLYFQQMKFLQGAVEARKSTDTLEAVDDTSREGAKRPRKKKDDAELQNQLLERAVEVLQEPCGNVSRADSEGGKFGAYVGHKLDSFNPRQRAIAIKRISDILFESEMANSSFGQVNSPVTANVHQHGLGDFQNNSGSPSPYSEYVHPTSYMAMLSYSHPNPGE